MQKKISTNKISKKKNGNMKGKRNMKKVIKEGLVGIAIIIAVAGFFIGTQLLSNYINYGTFLFNQKGVMNLIAQKKKIRPNQGKSSNVIKITARL